MKKTMEDLARAAAALNAESDALNETIERFDSFLQKNSVGITRWLEYDDCADDISSWGSVIEPEPEWGQGNDAELLVVTGYQVGYAKVDGQWRIAVRRVRCRRIPAAGYNQAYFAIEQESPPTKLGAAPRNIRIQAAAMLEDLAVQLTEQMQKYERDIRRVRDKVLDEGGDAGKPTEKSTVETILIQDPSRPDTPKKVRVRVTKVPTAEYKPPDPRELLARLQGKK